MSSPIFPAPDHDHNRCSVDALRYAETLCDQRAQKLTPTRRQVLEALLENHKPRGEKAWHAARADHGLSRARFPDRERARSPDRKPQCLYRLRASPRRR
jgi:hypothetical protein